MVTSANLVSASARRREHDRNAQWTSLDPDARFDLGQRSTRTQWLHGRLPCVIVGLNKAVTLADCHSCGGPRDFSPKYYCSLAKLTKFRGAKRGANAGRRQATPADVQRRILQLAAHSSDARRRPATQQLRLTSEGSLVRTQLRPPGRRGEHVPGVLPRLPCLQAVRGLGRLTLAERSSRIALMHAFDGRLPPGASGCHAAVCQRPSSALRISSARRLRKGYCGAWPIPVEELREQHPVPSTGFGDGSPIRRHPQG